LQPEQIPDKQNNLNDSIDDEQYEEFTNLNIKGNASENASESDDEREQRIFQFSPLSSKKQNGEGEESSEQEDDETNE
jgi:hypothetical protein